MINSFRDFRIDVLIFLMLLNIVHIWSLVSNCHLFLLNGKNRDLRHRRRWHVTEMNTIICWCLGQSMHSNLRLMSITSQLGEWDIKYRMHFYFESSVVETLLFKNKIRSIGPILLSGEILSIWVFWSAQRSWYPLFKWRWTINLQIQPLVSNQSKRI